MDIQVSLMRLLLGDNDRNAPLYSDAQLRGAISLGPVRPTIPAVPDPIAYSTDVLLAGARAAHVYPSDVSGGPWTGKP